MGNVLDVEAVKNMKLRKLPKKEHWRTRELWERIFTEDTSEFLDYYYSVKAAENDIYVIEDAGEIVAMLHLNPYRMRIEGELYDTHYIVAVATDENYRKKGLMKRLLECAMRAMKRRGEPFTFLMPASESIYRGFGFKRIYEQPSSEIAGKFDENSDLEFVPAKEEDCLEIAMFANYYLRDYDVVTWRTEHHYQVLLKEFESENGGILLAKKGGKIKGFCCYANEGHLEIREPMFRNEEILKHCIYQFTKDETTEVLCVGYGNQKKEPMIMAKILNPELQLDFKKAKVFLNEVV